MCFKKLNIFFVRSEGSRIGISCGSFFISPFPQSRAGMARVGMVSPTASLIFQITTLSGDALVKCYIFKWPRRNIFSSCAKARMAGIGRRALVVCGANASHHSLQAHAFRFPCARFCAAEEDAEDLKVDLTANPLQISSRRARGGIRLQTQPRLRVRKRSFP